MVKKVLLVSANLIKSTGNLESNVDESLLSKTILRTQEINLRPIIGKDLYETILNEVYLKNTQEGFVINELLTTLLNDYIQPYLIAATEANFIITNNYKYGNKGIIKLSDNSGTAISSEELEYNKNYYDNYVSTYKTELLNFLTDNKLGNGTDTDTTTESIGWYLNSDASPAFVNGKAEESLSNEGDPVWQAERNYYYKKTTIDSTINGVNASISAETSARQSDVANLTNIKANKTDVDTSLALKTDNTSFNNYKTSNDAAVALKSDKTYVDTNLANKLDLVKKPVVTTVTGLRATTAPAVDVMYQTTDMGGGQWFYDSTDTASTDNTGTVIVASGGKRFKRYFSGAINAAWFGMVPNGADISVTLQLLVDTYGQKGIEIQPGTYNISNNVVLFNCRLKLIGNVTFRGEVTNGALITVRTGTIIDGTLILIGTTKNNTTAVEFGGSKGYSCQFSHIDYLVAQNYSIGFDFHAYSNTTGGIYYNHIRRIESTNNNLAVQFKTDQGQNNVNANRIEYITMQSGVNGMNVAGGDFNSIGYLEGENNTGYGLQILNAQGFVTSSGWFEQNGINLIIGDNPVVNGINITASFDSSMVSGDAKFVINTNISNVSNRSIKINTNRDSREYGTLRAGLLQIGPYGTVQSDTGVYGAMISGGMQCTRKDSTSNKFVFQMLDAGGFHFTTLAGSTETLDDTRKTFFDKTYFYKSNGQLRINNGAEIHSGFGSPEGIITAPVGSIYLRADGSAGTTFYTKEINSGNIGWKANVSQAALALKADLNAPTFTGAVTATQFQLSDLNTAPASSTATGGKGEIRITADYIYVCVATNTWVRSPLTTW